MYDHLTLAITGHQILAYIYYYCVKFGTNVWYLHEI